MTLSMKKLIGRTNKREKIMITDEEEAFQCSSEKKQKKRRKNIQLNWGQIDSNRESLHSIWRLPNRVRLTPFKTFDDLPESSRTRERQTKLRPLMSPSAR